MAQEAGGSSPLAHPTILSSGPQVDNLRPACRLSLCNPQSSALSLIQIPMQNFIKIDQPEILAHLFQPPSAEVESCPANAEDVVLAVGPGVVLNCRHYSFSFDSPTLFYFHGGNESRESFDIEAEKFIRYGLNVFLASYRGYSKSTGTPSVSSIFDDGRTLLPLAAEWLKNHGYSGSLFVMGRSLGSVCAIDIVHTKSELVKGLVIESGFCETVSLLQAIGVQISSAELAEHEGFNNLHKISEIKLPTLIFHGAKDSLVPVAQAEKLQACSGARNKQFFIIPGAAHDTVSETGGALYFQKIKEFVNTVCGVNTWRQRRKESKAGRTGESV